MDVPSGPLLQQSCFWNFGESGQCAVWDESAGLVAKSWIGWLYEAFGIVFPFWGYRSVVVSSHSSFSIEASLLLVAQTLLVTWRRMAVLAMLECPQVG